MGVEPTGPNPTGSNPIGPNHDQNFQPENSPAGSSPTGWASIEGISLSERAHAVEFPTRLLTETELSASFKQALDLLGVEDGNGGRLSEAPPALVNERLQAIFWKGEEDENALAVKGGEVDFKELFVAELNKLFEGQTVESPHDLIRTLDQLDMFYDLGPKLQRVDIAVVLGATAPAIVHRINYLVSKINEGEFDAAEVIFSGGERKLLESDSKWIESFFSEHYKTDAPTPRTLPFIRHDGSKPEGQQLRFNEALFGKWYVDNHCENCPETWRGKDGVAQPASPVSDPDGKITTVSTAVALKSLFPKNLPVDVAVVSSQPHGPRQGADMLYTLLTPSGDVPGWNIRNFDVLAPASKTPKPPTVLLKELAGQLKRECQLTGILEQD